jgi:hypothetical protein
MPSSIILRASTDRYERSWIMLSLVKSQAVAISQLKQGQGGALDGRRVPAPEAANLFVNVFDALVESRMRKAEIEIEAHRHMYGDGAKK